MYKIHKFGTLWAQALAMMPMLPDYIAMVIWLITKKITTGV